MEQMNTDVLSDAGSPADGEIMQRLSVSARWAGFIAIVMFGLSVLFLLFGFAGRSVLMRTFGRLGRFGALSQMRGYVYLTALVLVVLFFVVLYYFLLRFSAKIRRSLITGSTGTMNAGLSSLKIYFMISGILGIVSLLSAIYSLVSHF